MTAPSPDAPSFAAFLRVLQSRSVGDTVSLNQLRDDVLAAQIPGQARGACFKAAAHAGYLRVCGFVPSTDPAARGRRILQYVIERRPEQVAA